MAISSSRNDLEKQKFSQTAVHRGIVALNPDGSNVVATQASTSYPTISRLDLEKLKFVESTAVPGQVGVVLLRPN